MTERDTLVEEMRSLESTRGSRASLEATLGELCAIRGAGMVRGRCLPRSELVEIGARLSDFFHEAFARYVDKDRRAARSWLGTMPQVLRPPAFDFSRWHTTLDIAPDRSAFLQSEQQKRDDWIAERLTRLGVDREAAAPRGLATLFGVSPPAELLAAWESRRQLRTRGVVFLSTIDAVLRATFFVAYEEMPLRGLDEKHDSEHVPPFLPFAKGPGEAIFFLDLTRKDASGDFAVCRFIHDAGDASNIVAKSAAAWLRRHEKTQ